MLAPTVLSTGGCSSEPTSEHTLAALTTAPGPIPCQLFGLTDDNPGQQQIVEMNVTADEAVVALPVPEELALAGITAFGDEAPELFGISGARAERPGVLFRVHLDDGRFEEVVDLGLRAPVALTAGDDELWIWDGRVGLVRIDVASRTSETVVRSNVPVRSIAWSRGTVYAFTRSRVLALTEGVRELVELGAAQSHLGPVTANANGQLLGLGEPQEPNAAIHLLTVAPAQARTIRRLRPLHIDGIDQPGPKHRLTALAWPLTCGTLSQPMTAPLIVQATAEPATVCEGGHTTVKVHAQHTEDPTLPVEVFIDGRPSESRIIQIPPLAGEEGLWYVDASAHSDDGLYDRRLVAVKVIECADRAVSPLFAATLNPFDPKTIDITVLNAAELGDVVEYEWEFGDGIAETTPYPHVEHDYLSGLETTEKSKNFDVRVAARYADGSSVNGARTITVNNDYAILRGLGSIQLPIDAPTKLDEETYPGAITVPMAIHNVEDQPVALTERRLRLHPCGAEAPVDTVEALSVEVPPNASTDLEVPVPGVVALWDDGICTVSVHFAGKTADGKLDAQAHIYLPIEPNNKLDLRYRPVTDPDLLAVLASASNAGITDRPDRIREDELHRLGLEGRLPLYSSSGVDVLGPDVGDRCSIDERAPRPGVACLATDDFEVRPPYIANALKGDSILSPGCGLIYEVLANVDPSQFWTHAGMMTRNYVEIRNATGSDSYPESFPEGALGLPVNGFEEDAARLIFPGTITQTIASAYFGEYLFDTQTNKNWFFAPFNYSPAACLNEELFAGSTSLTFPQVIRPPLDATAEHRARLERAADFFENEVRGHYRLSAYSDAAAAADNVVPSDHRFEWARGTNGLVCSSAPWSVFRQEGIAMEGQIEPSDRNEFGAEDDDQTVDGLYLYNEEERRTAGQHLWTLIHNKARIESKLAYVGAAANQIANQMVSCFASDDCSPRQYHNGYENPGLGRAISPDHMLLWDPPGVGGPYGEKERMALVQGDFRRVYRWAPSVGTGTVNVAVTFNGVPVQGVRVDVFGPVQTTDAAGRATFLGVPAGLQEASAVIPLGGGKILSGEAPVTVEAGQTHDLPLALQSPPSDAFVVTIGGQLNVVDDEPWPRRSEKGTINIGYNSPPMKTIMLNGQSPTHTEAIRRCVGGEILVEGTIQLTLVTESTHKPRVDVEYNIAAFEWRNECDNPSDSERFGIITTPDGGAHLFDDGVDSDTPGDSEVHRIAIDWTNEENLGGDTVKGQIAIVIEPPTNHEELPPMNRLRLVRVRGEAIFRYQEHGKHPYLIDSPAIPFDHAILVAAGTPAVRVFDQCGLMSTGLRIRMRVEVDPSTLLARVTNEALVLSGLCPGEDFDVGDGVTQTINLAPGETVSGGTFAISARDGSERKRSIGLLDLSYSNSQALSGEP